ncbi:MAG TPA: DinB family protein [Candidatus Thermoplasmatota archaeon]|nr:DinB family protein [Candidatus Thermoplasmatota archaeon]
MPSDPARQTRDYIAEQARTRTVEQVIELVEADTVRLHENGRSFPPDDLGRPLDGDWTPLACVVHIVERSMLRAREVLYVAVSGELPPPEELSLPADLEGLLATHREAIDSLYAHVREAPEDFKSFEWSHPFFGAMTWPEWLVFIHVHIADHAGQLERMAAAR